MNYNWGTVSVKEDGLRKERGLARSQQQKKSVMGGKLRRLEGEREDSTGGSCANEAVGS